MSQSLVGGRGTIHAQTPSRKAFLKKHAQTLFIVENEYRAARKKIGFRSIRLGRAGPSFRRCGNCVGMLVRRGREIDGKGRPARGKCFGLDVSSVLANDGHADAEPQAGAAAGTLGGVKGIEDAWKCFGADAHAVILNGDGNLITVAARTDLDSAVVTNFADGLLGVGNKVQKNLNKLV